MNTVWVITERIPFEDHEELCAICANKKIAEKLKEEYKKQTQGYFIYKIEQWNVAK